MRASNRVRLWFRVRGFRVVWCAVKGGSVPLFFISLRSLYFNTLLKNIVVNEQQRQ